MQIACAKGCGDTIEVSMEQIEEAARSGMPLAVAHDPYCPNDPRAPQHEYKTTVIVERRIQGAEEYEMIARASGTVTAPSFERGMEALAKELNQSWDTVVSHASIADEDAPTEPVGAFTPDFDKMKAPELHKWAEKNNVDVWEKVKNKKDAKVKRKKEKIAADLKRIRPENLLRPS